MSLVSYYITAKLVPTIFEIIKSTHLHNKRAHKWLLGDLLAMVQCSRRLLIGNDGMA